MLYLYTDCTILQFCFVLFFVLKNIFRDIFCCCTLPSNGPAQSTYCNDFVKTGNAWWKNFIIIFRKDIRYYWACSWHWCYNTLWNRIIGPQLWFFWLCLPEFSIIICVIYGFFFCLFFFLSAHVNNLCLTSWCFKSAQQQRALPSNSRQNLP